MNVEIENCIPRSAYFPALQEFDHETHEGNEKSAKLYRKFIALYQSLQISTETSTKLSIYYEQLGALSKIFKLLAPRSASQDKENMSPCKANTTPSLLQLDSLMNGIKNIPGLTGFAEYQSFAHAHLMAITGGLILQKSSNEDEWVSPKFGLGSDSSAIKSSSIKKDIRTVMQDLSQISEVHAPKEAFMNALISADSHVKYDQTFNSTDFGELSWSYHDSPKLTEKINNTCVEESKSKPPDLGVEGDSKRHQNHRMEIENPISSIRHKELREEIITQENEIEEKSTLPAKTKKKRNSKKSVESHIEEDEKAKDSIETYLKECKDPKEKKIIKQYSKRLNDLLKKPLLSETENKLMDVEECGINSIVRRKKTSIEEQLQIAKSWLQEYHQQVVIENKSINQIEELLDEIDTSGLRVPEMETLLKRQLDLTLWRLKVDSALKILDEKKSMTSKSKSPKKSQQELLSLEELENIVIKARQLELNEDFEDPGYYELRRKFEDVQSIQMRYESSGNDLSILRKLSKELSSLCVCYPKLEAEIQRKIQLNERVIGSLESMVSVEELTKFIKKLKNKVSDIDPSLYFQLCQKGEDAAKIQESVREHSTRRDSYEYNQIKEMHETLLEVKSLKIEVSGLERLDQVVNSFLWVMKLDKTRRGDQVPEMTFGEPSTDMDTSFDFLEEEIDINEIIETCKKWILKDLKPASVTRCLQSDLKQLVEDGENLCFYDQRMQALFDCIKNALQRLSDYGMDSKEKNKKLIQKYDDQEMIEEQPYDSWNGTDDHQTELPGYEIWSNSYNQIIVEGDLESFLRNRLSLEDPSSREATISSIKSKLASLWEDADKGFEKRPDFSEKVKNVKRLISWINWFSEAEACSRSLETNPENRLSELRKLNNQALEFDVPRSWALHNQVKKLLALADQVLNEYHNKFSQSFTANHSSQSQFRSSQKESLHKLIEKNKGVPLVSEAEIMREELTQTLYYVDCREQISELDRKIENYANWKEKVDSYINNEGPRVLQAALEPNLVLEDLNSIEQKLCQLSSQFVCLGLREEQDEKLLEGLECQLRAYLLVKNLSRRPPTVDEWKKVIEYIEENPELDPTDQKGLINRMKSEIEQAATQSQFVKDLQNGSQRGPSDRIPLESLTSALHDSQNGLVKNPDDELFVSELIQKTEALVHRFEELKAAKEKAPATEFTKILEQFKLLSVSVLDKENEIEEALNLSNRIISFIRKYILMDLKTTEEILQQYKNCPIFILEAERLQSKYNSSKVLYERLKETLNNALNNSKSLSYSQLEEIADELDDLTYDFEGNLNFMKALTYTFRIEYFQKLAALAEAERNSKIPKKQKDSGSVTLTPQSLKTLAKEGHEIKKAFKQTSKALNQAVMWMDNTVYKSEEKLREIADIADSKQLKEIEPLMMGFIDLSETINERKLRISSEQMVEKPNKKILLDEADKDDNDDDEEEKKKSKKSSLDENISQNDDFESVEIQIETQKNKKPKKPVQQSKTESQKGKSQESSQHSKDSVQKKEVNSTSPSRPLIDKKEFAKVKEDLLKPLKERPFSEKSKTTTKPTKKETSKKAIDPSGTDEKKIKKDDKEKPRSLKPLKTIHEILKDNLILSLDEAEALSASKCIIKAFPILQKSSEKLEKFTTQLKKILQYPNICSFLSETSLCPKEIFKLLPKSSAELIQFEERLEKSSQPKARKPPKIKSLIDEEDLEEQVIKKKAKTDQTSRVPNVIDTMISELAKKLEPMKESPMQKIIKGPEPKPIEAVPQPINLLLGEGTPHIEDTAHNFLPKSVLKSQPKESFLPPKQKPKSVRFQMEEEDVEPHPANEETDTDLLKELQEANKRKSFNVNHERIRHYKKHNGYRRTEFEESNEREKFKSSTFAKTKSSRASLLKEKPKPALQIPPDSVLKIFDGTIKGIEEEPAGNIGLYTCDPADKVTLFPKIIAENDNLLRIQGRMDFSRIEPYVNRFMATFDDKKDFITSGWVESSDSECQDNCENMALRFYLKQKVGMMKFYECAKIFFFHEKQFRPEWLRWLKFQRKDLKADCRSTLFFLFIYRPSKFPFDLSKLKKIEPEVVIPYEDKTKLFGSKKPEIEEFEDEFMDFGVNRSGKSSKNLSDDDELEHSLAARSVKQLEQNYSFQERKSLAINRSMVMNAGKSSREKKMSVSKVKNSQYVYSRADMEPEETADLFASAQKVSDEFIVSPDRTNDDYESLFGPTSSSVQQLNKQTAIDTEDIWGDINGDSTTNDYLYEDDCEQPTYEDEKTEESRDVYNFTKKSEIPEAEEVLSNQEVNDIIDETQELNRSKDQKQSKSKRLAPSELFAFLDKIQNQQADCQNSKQNLNPFAERTNITLLPSGPCTQAATGNYKKNSEQKYTDMEFENENDGLEDPSENLFNISTASNKRASLDKSYKNVFGASDLNRKSNSLLDSTSKNSLFSGPSLSKLETKSKTSLRF